MLYPELNVMIKLLKMNTLQKKRKVKAAKLMHLMSNLRSVITEAL